MPIGAFRPRMLKETRPLKRISINGRQRQTYNTGSYKRPVIKKDST